MTSGTEPIDRSKLSRANQRCAAAPSAIRSLEIARQHWRLNPLVTRASPEMR
jgi:hypothetical protein